ncbi:MAG: MucR family transcriptional regulator [Caulobacteraceae bacterium]|nr:MucR family transcriptional regulator [Caulobacteraceae bacterium]
MILEQTIMSDDTLRELVGEVAAAYFSNSHVAIADIQKVIDEIAVGLVRVGASAPAAEASAPEAEGEAVAAQRRLTPAQIRKSVTPEALISFEDGRGYKTLRRHLSVKGLTPEQYREKWGLPRDYPMVSPTYSAQRSEMARSIGLGQKGRGGRGAAAPVATGAKRGRRKAASES